MFALGILQATRPQDMTGPSDATLDYTYEEKKQWIDDLHTGKIPPLPILIEHGGGEKNYVPSAEANGHFEIPQDTVIGHIREAMLDDRGYLYGVGQFDYNHPALPNIIDRIRRRDGKWGFSMGTDAVKSPGVVHSKRFAHAGLTDNPEFYDDEFTRLYVGTYDASKLDDILLKHFVDKPNFYTHPRMKARFPKSRLMSVGASKGTAPSELPPLTPDATTSKPPSSGIVASHSTPRLDMAEQQIPPPPDSSASSQQQQQQQQQQGELPAAQQLEQLKAEKERKDRIEASVLRLDAAINAAKQLNADESQLVAANAKNMDLYFQIQATLKEINTHLGELGHGIPPTEIRAITRKLYDYIDDMDKILQKTVPDMNLPEDVKASHMEAFKEPVVHRDKLLSIFASGTAMSNAREARAALDRERAELEKARAAEKAQYEKDKMDWEAASKKRQRDEEEAQLAAAKRQRTEQSNGYLSSFTLKSLETPAAPTGSVPPATATFPLGINFAQGAAANNIAHAPRSISIGASKMTITRQYPLDGLAAVPKRDYAISNAFILREPSEMSALEQKRLRTFQAARDNLMNLKLTIPYDNAVATHSQFQHDTDVHT